MKKVVAALLTQNDRILIAKRKSDNPSINKWEFPGGKIEDGETPQQSLRREMDEELGIQVNVGEFFDESIYEYEFGTIHLLAYWVSWQKGDIYPIVHEEVKWVPFNLLDQYDFLPADLPLIYKLKNY
ncbi:(deoxy)nucleoside triphosphate pyrophosphohydrolase [Petroclostridium sp. X23]|uniref:(deoxy)nucleoside triphosphate pyrophosphohydrolase n=1 Tax=Petroclostridium sp. X23 TaxID=3045146 RepID=UPI0024ADA4AB|nr:(deoxy)nucleoside triphosphate pyrophosphohydrolase [Petroclostridium sp. X23]WHH57279.1 (deoxy)nucleoside triphosphate pyrophosphohydrolase [Petroclostridium sp. X23]